jgi:hypothetical protein
MSSLGLTLFEHVKVFANAKFTWEEALDNKCPSRYGLKDICNKDRFGSEELCKKMLE